MGFEFYLHHDPCKRSVYHLVLVYIVSINAAVAH